MYIFGSNLFSCLWRSIRVITSLATRCRQHLLDRLNSRLFRGLHGLTRRVLKLSIEKEGYFRCCFNWKSNKSVDICVTRKVWNISLLRRLCVSFALQEVTGVWNYNKLLFASCPWTMSGCQPPVLVITEAWNAANHVEDNKSELAVILRGAVALLWTHSS